MLNSVSDAYNLFRGAMVKPRFADRGGAKGAECCGLCHTGPHSLARGDKLGETNPLARKNNPFGRICVSFLD